VGLLEGADAFGLVEAVVTSIVVPPISVTPVTWVELRCAVSSGAPLSPKTTTPIATAAIALYKAKFTALWRRLCSPPLAK
jgi:hypothetical protein